MHLVVGLFWEELELPIFSPSGAQWCPKWLQGCPKGAKMKLKCRPRSSKFELKLAEKSNSGESVSVREAGG